MTRRSIHPIHTLWVATLLLFVLPGCGDGTPDALPGNGNANGAAAQTPPADPPPADEERVVNLADLGFNEGREGADMVYVVEFSDFGCVHCARFHTESFEVLKEEFIDGDQVLWKYIPISIAGFPNGEEAGVAGTCAGFQDRLPPMRTILYERRTEWSTPEQDPSIFREYAEEAGLDLARFDQCRESGEALEELRVNGQLALEIGINATPTFLVQGQGVQGAPPLEAFQDVLRRMVAEVRDP